MPEKQYPGRLQRLPGYDYSRRGAYFVTICTQHRGRWFGRVEQKAMILSAWGTVAAACWHSIPEHFAGVELDAFVVMPDHVHGLLWLPGNGPVLSTIVGNYKAAVSRAIRRADPSAPAVLWQRTFHDRIVRDERALTNIRRYIEENPRK